MKRTLGFVVASLASICAFAQTPNPNQALIDAKARLDAQTQRLESEAALLKARIGTFPTGKEGAITLGTAVAYPIGALERVYERLGALAKNVCDAVASDVAGKKKVLLAPND